VTHLAQARVIVLADHALAQRRRARRFWGTMGVLLRFEDRRGPRADLGTRPAERLPAVRRSAFDTRAPRGR